MMHIMKSELGITVSVGVSFNKILRVCQLIGLKKEDTLKIHIAANLHDINSIIVIKG